MTEAVFAVTPSETIKYVVTYWHMRQHQHLSPFRGSKADGFRYRTKLIEDSRQPQPRYRGLIHGAGQIVKEEGIGGIYRGLLPVVSSFPSWVGQKMCILTVLHSRLQMMRQGANSAVRFTAYSALKQAVQGSAGPSQQLPSTVTFGIGAIAGIITVCE